MGRVLTHTHTHTHTHELWISSTSCEEKTENWKTYIHIHFLKLFIYLFLERGEGREKEGEKHQCVVASHTPPTGDLAHNPGTCTDGESNQQPFGLQVGAQSTELHQPGPFHLHFYLPKSFKEIRKDSNIWTPHQKDIQMTKMQMKRRSTSLAIKEMQTKARMRCRDILTRTAKTKTLTMPLRSRTQSEQESHTLVVGARTRGGQSGKQVDSFL